MWRLGRKSKSDGVIRKEQGMEKRKEFKKGEKKQ
jgi:hypothetical protein